VARELATHVHAEALVEALRRRVEVGDEQELCIRRVADSLRRQAYGDKQN